MSKNPTTRADFSRCLRNDFGRELSYSTILFHQAVADRLGLNISDHKCLDLVIRLNEVEPVTAGKLAQLTGLTTGAITGVLDRLERAGFVRREKDEADRRQVNIKVLPDRLPELQALFEPLGRDWERLCARYSDEELGRFCEFSESVIEMMRAATERLRAATASSWLPGFEQAPELDRPVEAGVTKGVLEMPRGASRLAVSGERIPELFRLRYLGGAPSVGGLGGKVTIEAPGVLRRVRDPKKAATELHLNAGLAWSIAIGNGVAEGNLDLREVQLAGLDIRGGAERVRVQLGAPAGEIPVRIAGGAVSFTLSRPAGVHVRLAVKGGAQHVKLDTLDLGAVGGPLRWETPGYGAGMPGYDIEIAGGAVRLIVEGA